MTPLDNAKDQLVSFTNKLFEELRESLRQEQPGNSTIGISFEPDTVLNYVPSHEIVKTGIYVSNDETMHVEVLLQNPESGLIHLEVYDELDPSKRFDFTSTGMFLRLFKPTDPTAYVVGKR